MTSQPERPLTEQQLTDIETRANAATPGPWELYEGYGPHFYAYLRGSHLQGIGTLNFGDGEAADADREFVTHAREDVPALLAEIRRLKGQRKYLLAQLAKRDAESGRGDEALREFLAVEQPAVEASEACGKCRQPFDPADTAFDGRARYHLTPYCRGCVDRCHDTEIADHRCVICA